MAGTLVRAHGRAAFFSLGGARYEAGTDWRCRGRGFDLQKNVGKFCLSDCIMNFNRIPEKGKQRDIMIQCLGLFGCRYTKYSNE